MLKLLSYVRDLARNAQQHRLFVVGTIAFGLILAYGSVRLMAQRSSELSVTKPSPKILATFLPVYLFTKATVGTSGQTEILIAPGTAVHEYQATPKDAKAIAFTNILVKNGLGLESFLDGLIENSGNSKLKQIDASKGIKVMSELAEETDHDHDHDHQESHNHDHQEGNPHVWLDPVLAQQQVANIRDGLSLIDPSNAKNYQANAAKYIKQLQSLDTEFKTRLAPLKGCRFMAFHDAYPYLAKRYNLRQMAVVELPEDNLTPQDLQKIMSLAKKYQVKALLSEPGIEDRRLQQIAKELKLPVQTLDPLESGPLDPEYYFQVMRKNLQTLESICQ